MANPYFGPVQVSPGGGPGGDKWYPEISAATAVKATPGRLARISVITAGSTAGTVNDAATTGAAGATNQFGTIPNTVGTYEFDWPCAAGIVVVPGTGQVLAASFT